MSAADRGRRSGHAVNGIAGQAPYLLMVLGVIAIYTAGFMPWRPASTQPESTWQPWLLLLTGGTVACATVALR
jgi:hypothetical protein